MAGLIQEDIQGHTPEIDLHHLNLAKQLIQREAGEEDEFVAMVLLVMASMSDEEQLTAMHKQQMQATLQQKTEAIT